MATMLRSRLLATTLLVGAAAIPSAAFAQGTTPPAASEREITVTGTRITNPNIEQSSPVSVVNAEEISLTMPVSVEEFLRELPGTASGIAAPVNNGSNGTATFNLRGLGWNRNLVLLNSRRVVPSALNAVTDLNLIPIALIERADIFTGGASSTYGADAIAGVVNFITRRDFAGFDVSATLGTTERGDGRQMRVDATIGANFDEGRGNAVFSVSYTDTQPVFQGDRQIGLVSRQSTPCSATQRANPANTAICDAQRVGIPQGSNTAVPASLFFPLPVSPPPPAAPDPFAAGAQFNPAGGNIIPGLADYNFNPINYFQTPLDRWTIFGSARYEISPAIEVFTEGFFVRSRVVQNIAPTGTFTNTFQIPLNNQFLTPTQRTQLCSFAFPTDVAGCPARIAAGTEITAIVARRFVETGGRTATFTTNAFQVVAGARGPLTDTLSWEISGQYGESDRQTTNTGTALADRVQQGLRNCPAGSAAGCVPINIFGDAGSVSQAALNFVGVPTSTFVNTELGAAQAVVTGDLGFAIPWATTPIGVAAGVEYRRYAGAQFGDLPSSTPGGVLGAGGAFTAIAGEYHSTEIFGEVIIPIVEERPFFYNLTIQGGYRYSDYSTSGGNSTWNAGGSWAPIRDIKFRGVYSRAVRAPNLGELFAPVNTVLNNLATDQCQGTNAFASPARTAICTAQLAAVGLPASRLGAIPAPIAGQINVTGGGNPNLRPERATTITAGFVFSPTFLPGFTATVDWYRIRVTDAITSPTVSDVLNGCFDTGVATNPLCALVLRNPLTGGLSGDPATTRGVLLQTSNLGRIEVEGVDFTVSYNRSFGPWRVGFNLAGNYTDKSRFQANPTGINRECVNRYSVSCDPALPQWTFNTRLTGGYEGTTVSILWRHINGLEVEPVAPPPGTVPVGQPTTAGPTLIAGYRSIPAYDYFDLAIRQEVGDNVEITFLIQNMFDKSPPDVGNTAGSTGFNSGNTFPVIYDALGRRYSASVRFRF